MTRVRLNKCSNMRVLTLTLSLMCLHVSAQTCSPIKFNRNHIGVRLHGHLIEGLKTDTIAHCAKECFYQTHCRSFNFYTDSSWCELNSEDSSTASADIVANQSSVYKDISSWPSIADACKGRPCSGKQRCVPAGQMAICENTDCADPPMVNKAKVAIGSVDIGATRSYKCSLSEHVLEGIDTVTCERFSRLSRWSPVKFKCRRPASCAEVKQCSATYTEDGHFWLYPLTLVGSKVKVYCHNMQTSEPKEYITVDPTKNDGKHHFGIFLSLYTSFINFAKIRLDVTTMVVIQDDVTFSSITGSALPSFFENGYYGMGSGCTEVDGYFHIDTTDTGLVVDPKLEWTAAGYFPYINSFSRSSDGRTISAIIGGECGYTKTVGQMVLYVNPAEVVPDTQAVFPSCD